MAHDLPGVGEYLQDHWRWPDHLSLLAPPDAQYQFLAGSQEKTGEMAQPIPRLHAGGNPLPAGMGCADCRAQPPTLEMEIGEPRLTHTLARLAYPPYTKAKPAKPMHTPAKSAIM